jgi:energy-coupling factor transporter ATP-binding protein EcfA2
LLKIEGLRVKNDGLRTAREWALSIDSLCVCSGDAIFVLGARGSGKSGLRVALKTIVESRVGDDSELSLQQSDEKPPVSVSRLNMRPVIRFHSQGGDPDTLPDAGEEVLVFCDDPMYPAGTSTPTGSQIIDIALERGLTLMIGADPDRLQQTLSHFLNRETGRILWLHEGRTYFDGSISQFGQRRRALCSSLEDGTIQTTRFIEIILKA